jgi:hypothetical protein
MLERRPEGEAGQIGIITRQELEAAERAGRRKDLDLNANLERQGIGRRESGDTARGRFRKLV